MQTYLDCIPCFLRQALEASRMATSDSAVHERVVRETLQMTSRMPFDASPPWMGQQIHRLLREATQNPDPYLEVKRHSNALALELYPRLREEVQAAPDPFLAAVSLAIAGNIIDFGCRSDVRDEDILQAIADARSGRLDNAMVADLRAAAAAAKNILYLADNAGEIVFDRLLIEQLPSGRVTLVVRGSPVINDATRVDAEAAGLGALVPVRDNGSDVPGTLLEACSPEFRALFSQSDLVIAKGQGNYETLSAERAPIIFLLKVKCAIVARDLHCDLGQPVIRRNSRAPARQPPAAS